MRLLFIRHGDPDYEPDALTEKGRREAEALAAIIRDLKPGHIYSSPLGRARETAQHCLNVLKEEAVVMPWLEEFPARVDVEESPELMRAFPKAQNEDGTWNKHIAWDIMPAYCAAHPELMDARLWRTSTIAKHSDLLPTYDRVREGFDSLLASYGYVRQEHGVYRVDRETQDTLTFFCHFGISAVLLSILWDISPFIPLQMMCMLTTSVTEIVTEEREEGVAMFRMLRFGDLTHLNMAGEEPSFAARYREVYSDTTHRK